MQPLFHSLLRSSNVTVFFRLLKSKRGRMEGGERGDPQPSYLTSVSFCALQLFIQSSHTVKFNRKQVGSQKYCCRFDLSPRATAFSFVFPASPSCSSSNDSLMLIGQLKIYQSEISVFFSRLHTDFYFLYYYYDFDVPPSCQRTRLWLAFMTLSVTLSLPVFFIQFSLAKLKHLYVFVVVKETSQLSS